MIDLLGPWREFERVVHDRGLDWGLDYAPAQLRYARPEGHEYGVRLDHLLPADYRAFVAEVGYPVVGFKYYDRWGISFLPPEAMAYLSVDLPDPDEAWPEPVEGEPTVCLHAFFAGTDLSDIEGYSFGPAGDGGEPVVWLVENGMPCEELGTFTEWFAGEIARLTEHAATFEPAPRQEDHEVADPHRLLDYSLGGDYVQMPYTAADLELTWVESAENSYSYGLVDGTGAWLIPLGMRFREVRPFRDGVAEVVLDADPGHWTKIRPDGTVVEAG
jgi:hypothetical protein